MDKRAYSVQMNTEVPDSEKRIAENTVKYFDSLILLMDDVSKYLDIIYIPFMKHDNVDMEMITDYRDTFRQYRDQIKKKFKNIFIKSYKCVSMMNEFGSDISISDLVDSFIDSIRELDKYIDTFVSIFSNLNNPDFRNNLVSTIDSIKKQLNQIEQLIKDRILEHIDTNILAKDWTSDFANALNSEDDVENSLDGVVDKDFIQKRVPLVQKLYEERQKALNGN